MVAEAMAEYGDHPEVYDDFSGGDSGDIMDMGMPRMDVEDLGLSDYDLGPDIDAPTGSEMDQIFYASDVNKEKMRRFLNMHAAEEGVEPFDLLVNMGFTPQVASNIMGMLGEMDQAKMGMTFSEGRVRRRDVRRMIGNAIREVTRRWSPAPFMKQGDVQEHITLFLYVKMIFLFLIAAVKFFV